MENKKWPTGRHRLNRNFVATGFTSLFSGAKSIGYHVARAPKVLVWEVGSIGLGNEC